MSQVNWCKLKWTRLVVIALQTCISRRQDQFECSKCKIGSNSWIERNCKMAFAKNISTWRHGRKKIWFKYGHWWSSQSQTLRNGMLAWKWSKYLPRRFSEIGSARCDGSQSSIFRWFLIHRSVEYCWEWIIWLKFQDYLILVWRDWILQLPKYSKLGPETNFIFAHNE